MVVMARVAHIFSWFGLHKGIHSKLNSQIGVNIEDICAMLILFKVYKSKNTCVLH